MDIEDILNRLTPGITISESALKLISDQKLDEELLFTVLELAGTNAQVRSNRYDSNLIILPYDVYFTFATLKRPLINFPFNLTQLPRNNLSSQFERTDLRSDFKAGLDDYLDTFVASVRQTPNDQIRAYLINVGIVPEHNPESNQNLYIAKNISPLNTKINNFSGLEPNFENLIQILS